MRRSPFVRLVGVPALVLVSLSAAPSAESTAPANSDRNALLDVSGTYVDASVRGECDIHATSGGDPSAARAVTVVYWRGLLTLRVVPTQTIRALHVQTRPRQPSGPSDSDNGLARLENGDLVVESVVPALPLWTRLTVPIGAATLVEHFAFSDASLTYRSAYRGLEGESLPGETFELTLAKCGVVPGN